MLVNFQTLAQEDEPRHRPKTASEEYTFCLARNQKKPPTTQRLNIPRPNFATNFRTIQQQEEPTDDIEEDNIKRKKLRDLSGDFLDLR